VSPACASPCRQRHAAHIRVPGRAAAAAAAVCHRGARQEPRRGDRQADCGASGRLHCIQAPLRPGAYVYAHVHRSRLLAPLAAAHSADLMPWTPRCFRPPPPQPSRRSCVQPATHPTPCPCPAHARTACARTPTTVWAPRPPPSPRLRTSQSAHCMESTSHPPSPSVHLIGGTPHTPHPHAHRQRAWCLHARRDARHQGTARAASRPSPVERRRSSALPPITPTPAARPSRAFYRRAASS